MCTVTHQVVTGGENVGIGKELHVGQRVFQPAKLPTLGSCGLEALLRNFS